MTLRFRKMPPFSSILHHKKLTARSQLALIVHVILLNFSIPLNATGFVIEVPFRMAKMGGRLCFTCFIEPNGRFLGTILEPLPKSQWQDWALKYTLKDMKIDQMIHQHDRYFLCFTK